MLGAGLTAAFTMLAGLVGAALSSPAVAAVLGLIALFAAGLLTVRMRPSTRALEPGLGAALLVLILGLVQLLTSETLPEEATRFQLAISLLVAVAVAFALAWTGGRAGEKLLSARGGRDMTARGGRDMTAH